MTCTISSTCLLEASVLAQSLGPGPQNGDANGDGSTDAFDLNIMASHWQTSVTGGAADGDFTGDGFADSFDTNVLASAWGQSKLQVMLPDCGGSTRLLTGSGGGTIENYGYDAYGTLIGGGYGSGLGKA